MGAGVLVEGTDVGAGAAESARGSGSGLGPARKNSIAMRSTAPVMATAAASRATPNPRFHRTATTGGSPSSSIGTTGSMTAVGA